MSFEEWFFNYYGRGKMGTVPTGPIPPGYDPNQAIQADLGRLGKRAKDYFERTFGEKSGPKLGEPMPGERPALQMPGLNDRFRQAKDYLMGGRGTGGIGAAPYASALATNPMAAGAPGISSIFQNAMRRPPPVMTTYQRGSELPPPPQTPYIAPYPNVPPPIRGRMDWPGAEPSGSGEPSPERNMNEPLPTQDEDEIVPPDYLYDTVYPGMREG